MLNQFVHLRSNLVLVGSLTTAKLRSSLHASTKGAESVKMADEMCSWQAYCCSAASRMVC
jgi:hypothetical protein